MYNIERENIMFANTPSIDFRAVMSEDINTFRNYALQLDTETLRTIGSSLLEVIDQHPALLVYVKLNLILNIIIQRVDSDISNELNVIKRSEMEDIRRQLKADLDSSQVVIVILKQEAILKVVKRLQGDPVVKSGHFKLDLAILFSEDINAFNAHIASLTTDSPKLTIDNLKCVFNILLDAEDKLTELFVKAIMVKIADKISQLSEARSNNVEKAINFFMSQIRQNSQLDNLLFSNDYNAELAVLKTNMNQYYASKEYYKKLAIKSKEVADQNRKEVDALIQNGVDAITPIIAQKIQQGQANMHAESTTTTTTTTSTKSSSTHTMTIPPPVLVRRDTLSTSNLPQSGHDVSSQQQLVQQPQSKKINSAAELLRQRDEIVEAIKRIRARNKRGRGAVFQSTFESLSDCDRQQLQLPSTIKNIKDFKTFNDTCRGYRAQINLPDRTTKPRQYFSVTDTETGEYLIEPTNISANKKTYEKRKAKKKKKGTTSTNVQDGDIRQTTGSAGSQCELMTDDCDLPNDDTTYTPEPTYNDNNGTVEEENTYENGVLSPLSNNFTDNENQNSIYLLQGTYDPRVFGWTNPTLDDLHGQTPPAPDKQQNGRPD
jgi:hypothetical protein